MFSNRVHDGKTETFVENVKQWKIRLLVKKIKAKLAIAFLCLNPSFQTHTKGLKNKSRTCSSDFAIPPRISRKFTFRSWSSLIAWDTKNVYKWILILYKAFDDGKDLDLSKILIKN